MEADNLKLEIKAIEKKGIEMADSNSLKNKRSHCRTKTTKAIKYALKLVSEELDTIKLKELTTKIETARNAADEHSEVHHAYLNALELEGKVATEILAEDQANNEVEQSHDNDLERLLEYAELGSLAQRNNKIQRSASLSGGGGRGGFSPPTF